MPIILNKIKNIEKLLVRLNYANDNPYSGFVNVTYLVNQTYKIGEALYSKEEFDKITIDNKTKNVFAISNMDIEITS